MKKEYSDFYQIFKDNTTFKKEGGVFTCECNKFLWSVSSKDWKRTLMEAFYYFQQYYYDGEYKEIEVQND